MIESRGTNRDRKRSNGAIADRLVVRTRARCLPWVFAVLTCYSAMQFASVAHAQAGVDENSTPAVQVINRENQFKAVFVFNFGQYLAWPDDDLVGAETPFEIGVVGNHDAVPYLERIVSARKRSGGNKNTERPVKLKKFAAPAAVKPVHILFLPRTVTAEQVKAIATAHAGEPTLLVGESDTFLDNGGMINLGVKDGKMHLSISMPALEAAHIKPSAALMRLTPDIRK